jgi:hypothetical protein
VYLFLTLEEPGASPNAKMPLVELPAADPPLEFAEATATPEAVEVHEEYVYLFLVLVFI